MTKDCLCSLSERIMPKIMNIGSSFVKLYRLNRRQFFFSPVSLEPCNVDMSHVPKMEGTLVTCPRQLRYRVSPCKTGFFP